MSLAIGVPSLLFLSLLEAPSGERCRNRSPLLMQISHDVHLVDQHAAMYSAYNNRGSSFVQFSTTRSAMLGTSEEQHKQTKLQNGRKLPTIGICIPGLARTFSDPIVHERYLSYIVETLRANGYSPSVFFYLTLDDDVRQGYQERNNEKIDVQRAMDNFSPAEVNTSDVQLPFFDNPKCEMPQAWTRAKLTRWYGQWSKVSKCYDMMVDYERSHGAFDFMMRIRPDLALLQEWDPSVYLKENKMTVPSGIVFHPPLGMNDHIIACSRWTCHAYFEIAKDYEQCSGNWEQQYNYSMGEPDGSIALSNRLKRFEIAKEEVPLEYTILRPCKSGGPECRRLGRDPEGDGCPYRDGHQALPNADTLCASAQQKCDALHRDLCK